LDGGEREGRTESPLVQRFTSALVSSYIALDQAFQYLVRKITVFLLFTDCSF
jgi:hypothetical protein